MTLPAAVALALIVWTIGLIRPVRIRALVYSLPIPMTLVLLSAPVRVDGTQALGVLLLVAFFATTALLHTRLGWPVLLADLAAAVGYVAVAWALPNSLPLLPSLLAVTALWGAGLLLLPAPPPRATAPPLPGWPLAALKLAAALAATLAVTAVGGLLAGLVVTFPYSGVLVAVEVRRDLVAFTRHFARAAIALVGFVAGYAAAQDHGVGAGLAAGWVAYGVCVGLLRWAGRGRGSGSEERMARGVGWSGRSG